MGAARDWWRSRTFWSAVFGSLICVSGGWEAIGRGTPPGVAWPVAAGAALKFWQDAFARDATVKVGETVAQAVREAANGGGGAEVSHAGE